MSGASIKQDVAKQQTTQDDLVNAEVRQHGSYEHSFRNPQASDTLQNLNQLKTPEQTTSNSRSTFVQRQELWSNPTPTRLEDLEKTINADENFRVKIENFVERYIKADSAPNTLNTEARENGFYDHPFRLPSPSQQPNSQPENDATKQLRDAFTKRQELWSSPSAIDALKNAITSDQKFRTSFEKFLQPYTIDKPHEFGLDFSSPQKPSLPILGHGERNNGQGNNMRSSAQGGDGE